MLTTHKNHCHRLKRLSVFKCISMSFFLDKLYRLLWRPFDEYHNNIHNRVAKIEKQVKHIALMQETLVQLHKDTESQQNTFQYEIDGFRAIIHKQFDTISMYETKLTSLNDVRENIHTIFTEIKDVRNYTGTCQKEMLKNMAENQHKITALNHAVESYR